MGRSGRDKFTTTVLRESDYETWNQLVAGSSTGSIYSTPEYLDTLCSVTGGRFEILGVMKGEELLGGIALYEEDTPFGRILSNRLLLYYNGVVLADFDTKYPSEQTSRQVAMIQALEAELSARSHIRCLLHCRELADVRPFTAAGWSAKPSYSYVMDISDLETAWSRVEQNLRRLVRRAEREGIVMTEDDDFDSFFRMHLETHQRKGAPLYLPRQQFKDYFTRLHEKGLATLYHARLDSGHSVAAQLVLLGPHPVSHTVCAGADGEYLNLGTTPFLRWKAVESLSAKGYTGNDLTDAALNNVTRFKSQLGGDLRMNMVVQKADSTAWWAREKALGVRNKLGRVYRLFVKKKF